MAIKLVTTLPFHGYAKGQEITDPEEVARLQEDREHHFVRVFVPDEPSPISKLRPEGIEKYTEIVPPAEIAAQIESDLPEHHDA